VKELSRTGAPDTTVVPDATFNTSTVDANGGVVFNFNGAGTTAITSVINGVEGKSIKIFGTDAAGVDVTLSDIGNINVASAATLADSNDFVQLTKVDGIWIETERSITV
jgi:hypothetical protein